MLGEKIRAIREENNYTQKDFAKKFNISYGTLQSYEYGETEPKLKFLEVLSKYFKIPMSYFYDDTVVNMSSNDKKNVVNASSIVSNSAIANWRKENKIPDKYSEIITKYSLNTNIINIDGYWITKISHNPSAGTKIDIESIEVYDDEDEKIFLPSNFFKTQLNEKSLRFFQVEGDSMYPRLKSGDWVVMKLVKEFTGDAMYVINYGNALMVKTLQIKPNGNLFIKSLNPEYESYEITQDSQSIFYIIGKVLKTIS